MDYQNLSSFIAAKLTRTDLIDYQKIKRFQLKKIILNQKCDGNRRHTTHINFTLVVFQPPVV